MKDKYYLLVTNDKYELITACADTLVKLSNISGIPFYSLWDSYRRNQTCGNGHYKVVLTNTDVQDYDFDFNNYIQFCEDYHLKPNNFKSIEKFKKLSN